MKARKLSSPSKLRHKAPSSRPNEKRIGPGGYTQQLSSGGIPQQRHIYGSLPRIHLAESEPFLEYGPGSPAMQTLGDKLPYTDPCSQSLASFEDG